MGVLPIIRNRFFQAGVSKLKEAREVVGTLKKKAADQSLILADKQKEADESMTEISNTIQVIYVKTLQVFYH